MKIRHRNLYNIFLLMNLMDKFHSLSLNKAFTFVIVLKPSPDLGFEMCPNLFQ